MDIEHLRNTFDAKSVSRWVTKEEIDTLISRIKEYNPFRVFESGTANGYSSTYISTAGFTVHTFDPANRKKVWLGMPKEVTDRIDFHNTSFTEAAEFIDPIRQSPLYYFVDGDHSPKGVKADFETIKPYLKPTDRVMFHDFPGEHMMTKYIKRAIVPLAVSYTKFATRNGMIELTF